MGKMKIGITDIQDAFASVPVRRAARVKETVAIIQPVELTSEEVIAMETRNAERRLAEEHQTEREAR